MSKEKQLFQVQNILDTIQEATDHFAMLIKNKELNQSIFTFSSIVEGCQSVMTMLNAIDKNFIQHTSKLENYLGMIANELEQGNFIKISGIIQFSFRPHLVKLNQAFIDRVGNQQKDKIISIGVFHSWRNPREFYTKERINAMVNESKKQDTILYFFTSDDVDFEKKQINADTFQSNSWERVTVPFPDVINNVGASRRSHVERKLRREVPFTSFHVGNKYTLPKRMVKYRKFVELLVPFKVCTNEAIIHGFLEHNNRVVFKALGSNRGENIYFITKKGSRYVMLDQKKERIISQDAFNDWVQNIILRKKGSYIIQRYIHTRTNEDEPYHFRAHVQKNGEGKWQLTHIYPRIGNKKSNLSNISTEGRIEDFPAFLRRQFGEKQGAKYEKKILKLSIDVAWHLDKLYGLVLDELGLDFAIDETGRIWMHEANNGPQTAFHEEKRAVNTIAYAKYIAKNGLMYTDAATKSAMVNGQFQANTADLPIAAVDNRPCIGMLAGKQTNDPLTVAFAREAKANNVLFYQFTPKDIDYDRGLIKAYFYENDEWVPRVAEYPDVVIDRLKMRGKQGAQFIYDELEDIPFNNEWAVHLNKRSEMYDSLQSNQSIANVLSDYQAVTRPRNVFQFIEKYGKVLLKPEKMSDITYSIEQISNNNYLVTEGFNRKKYREMPLRNFIKDLMEKRAYIVQQDLRMQTPEGELSEIHIHVMKDENNEWSIVSQYAKVQKSLDNNLIEEQNEDFPNFIERIYGIDSVEVLQKQMKNLSLKAASVLEEVSEVSISEVALIASINEKQQLGLLEIDPNGPETVYDAKLHANSVISCAKSLASKDMESLEQA